MGKRSKENRGFNLAEALAQDLRYAGRSLRRSLGFAATSIVVLGLAIGVNTAVFSVLHAVLLKPLSYPSPDQLAMLWTESPSENLRGGRSAYWNIEQWSKTSKSFAAMAAFDPISTTLVTPDRTERIMVIRTAPNVFPMLGIRPLQGRIFDSQDAERKQSVAVISDRFWRERFAGSPDAVGSTVEIGSVPTEIVGIIPAGTRFFGADVWEPHTSFEDWDNRRTAQGAGSWFVIARLRTDVTIASAQEEMSAISRSLDEQLPVAMRDRGVSVMPFSLYITGPRARSVLWMLTGAVFLVLLIAISNAANLSLARNTQREREIATRAALGASSGRIVIQMLTESVALALAAGVLGVLIAQGTVRVILAMRPANLGGLESLGFNVQVLGWTLALCLLSGITVGLLPLVTFGRNLDGSTRQAGRGISGGVTARSVRRALVVTEFALAIVLLSGAGLLIRSAWLAQNVEPGYRPERVLSVQLSIPATRADAQRVDFYTRALEQAVSLPGVESAGIIGDFFIGVPAEPIVTTEANGQTRTERIPLRRDEISNDFFRTVGVPLLRGRTFSAEDRADSPRVAIVNETMSRRLWPGADAMGKRFKLGADSAAPWFTVVGVVGDMRRQGPEPEPVSQMFEPLVQNPSGLATLLVLTSVDDPLKLADTLQVALHRVDRYVAVYGFNTLADRQNGFLAERRFQTSLLTGFSLAALLMAAIGIYGLMQYSVAARRQEIGIRMAIGAGAGEIFRMILREGLTLSLIGLALGLIGASWMGRAISTLLFGVTAADSWIPLSVSVLLIAVTTAACYFPARRAMKVELVEALRQN